MSESVLIVTPSLNQGRFIRTAIESVLAQDFTPLAYRVIDGGSTDGTIEILREYESDARFEWISEPDGGQAHAICKGIKGGGGEILAWLNADDAYFPGAIAEGTGLLRANPAALMVSGGVHLVDEAGAVLGLLDARELALEDLLNLREYIPQPGVFIRRAAYEQSGGLDETLTYAFDLDLFIRLRLAGEMCYSSSTFAIHRLHSRSKTVSQHPSMRLEAAKVARRFVSEGHFNGTQRRALISRMDLVEAYASYRLGSPGHAIWKLLAGLARYPRHMPLLAQGIRRLFSDSEQFVYGRYRTNENSDRPPPV